MNEAQRQSYLKAMGLTPWVARVALPGAWLSSWAHSQAPGLGRFEAPLMANLLALFQGRPQRPRRFFCPLTEQPMPAHEAAQALSAFVAGLSEQSGGERVLLCLPETVAEALFEQPRYQPFELGRLPALVISSLAEMLADPVQHKKASWQAMQAHGYDGV